MTEVRDLLKDKHFLLKLADAVALFYGTINMCEFGYFPNVLQSIILAVAFPGGLISILILMYMYKNNDKNAVIEEKLLMIYGTINVFAGYVTYTTTMEYMGLPNSIHNPVTLMLMSSLFAGCSMLGEVSYNVVKTSE